MGYSYYEYANSLKDNDIFSALLYSEYALELGNLDIYFKESDGKNKNITINRILSIDKKLVGAFVIGMLIGAIGAFLVRRRDKKVKIKVKRKR